MTNKKSELKTGDILFLIACSEIIEKTITKNFTKTLCIHESDLPEGKGWSPCVYHVLDGKNEIPLTLFEAIDDVDSGDIWKKTKFDLEGHELADEINKKVSEKTLELIDFAIKSFDTIIPQKQGISDNSYFKRRTPDDSELDINKTIIEQLNLMRIADENRYPCFFYYKNHRYKLILKKF